MFDRLKVLKLGDRGPRNGIDGFARGVRNKMEMKPFPTSRHQLNSGIPGDNPPLRVNCENPFTHRQQRYQYMATGDN